MSNLMDKLVQYSSANITNLTNKESRVIRGFLEVWISTTIIMWLYVAFSYFVFEVSVVGNLGLVYTLLHSLSPVIFRYTKSLVLTGLNISITAMLFQVTFCIYNGGILSPAAIWFTAHPVIISFFASKRLIIFSVFLNMLAVLLLTILGDRSAFPADTLSGDLSKFMMISSLIGLDIIIATYTIVFINKTKFHEKELFDRNQLIEQLMRIISHDINNSLGISMGYTEQMIHYNEMSENENKDKISKILNRMRRANQQILEISTSTSEWMKTKERSFALKKEPISVGDILKHVNGGYLDALNTKSIELIVECNIPHSDKIIGDCNAFRYQVLNNIFFNSIKFSPINSKIIFNISKHNNKIEIRIIDKGIGIPQDLLNGIFDVSRNVSRKGTSGEEGTGFGMPIAKTIVELMGGEIFISSIEQGRGNEENGTTTLIEMPLYIED